MGLTYEAALAELDSISSKEGLRDLISRLDITAGGSVTVLYSGPVNGE